MPCSWSKSPCWPTIGVARSGSRRCSSRPQQLSRIVLLNTGAFPPPYVPWRIAACRLPLLGTLAIRGLNLFARAAITMAMSRQRLEANVARRLAGTV